MIEPYCSSEEVVIDEVGSLSAAHLLTVLFNGRDSFVGNISSG